MSEISVEYLRLSESIGSFKRLCKDTEYKNKNILENSQGSMATSSKEVYAKLVEVEAVLHDIVERTKKTMENAGMKFSESEDLISNILDTMGSLSGTQSSQRSIGDSMPISPYGGWDSAQCAGYAAMRWHNEYPNIDLGGGNAGSWLETNRNRPGITVVEGDFSDANCIEQIKNTKCPFVAVTEGINQYGHVVVIEGFTLNPDGTVNKIFYSESNGDSNDVWNSGVDGVLKETTIDFFCGAYKVKGFVCASN